MTGVHRQLIRAIELYTYSNNHLSFHDITFKGRISSATVDTGIYQINFTQRLGSNVNPLVEVLGQQNISTVR